MAAWMTAALSVVVQAVISAAWRVSPARSVSAVRRAGTRGIHVDPGSAAATRLAPAAATS
jgi:hypothetical protein